LSAVIAASKFFRQTLLELPLFEPLCKFNMKDLLGEGGEQALMDVFKPMYAENAPKEVRAETFWYCWTQFLCETCLDEAQSINFSLIREERLDTGPRFDESTHVPPLLDLMPAESITIFEE
jgi:hypothetical protein